VKTFSQLIRALPATRLLNVVACTLAIGCAERSRTEPLDLATTTSVKSSGLLDYVLPEFTERVVHVHAAGSGRSLAMLDDQIVDVVITHAPRSESEYLAKHPDWVYQKFAYNRFVIVGPAEDPAGASRASSAADALRRIAESPMGFVSRADGSGTHEREQAVWKESGVMMPSDRMIISGTSMSVALRHADERQAYTISDQATFWQLRDQLDLVELFGADATLINTYAAVYSRHNARAESFVEWLISGDGRAKISAYKVNGHRAFSLWPAGCPDSRPDFLPCF
jgi:tungstate transport system substrate-binding protein